MLDMTFVEARDHAALLNLRRAPGDPSVVPIKQDDGKGWTVAASGQYPFGALYPIAAERQKLAARTP